MKTITLLFSIVLLLFSARTEAQNDQNIINEGPQGPTLVVDAIFLGEIPSIESQIANGTFKPTENLVKEFNPKRWGSNTSVPGKGLPVGNDPLWDQQSRAAQTQGRAPILTFEAAASGSTPTDPTGAVGPNHFVNSWNSAFRIWDKAGNPLTPEASLGTIFPGTLGDPIVIYDRYADRFLITEFYFNGFDVAISQGSNPVTSGWYVYRFPTSSFPDYPKFSVWSDGYYITANKDAFSAGSSQVVFAVDRAKMIVGDPTATMQGFPLPGIVTSGFYSPLGFNANGPVAPPAGNVPVVYMQDDSWGGVASDHLKLWSINVNWTTPASSTISAPQIIPTTPFDGLFDGGSFSNLPQPPGGQDIDALQATIMFMAQYRRFPGYNSAVLNFVVDLNGADNYSGIRWFELRQPTDGAPWSIYQEGTYAAPGGQSAFCGNMCMDQNGSIGLAYTIVNTSTFPSLRFTGRRATDPLGTMTLTEDVIANGTEINPYYRYGDYAQMTIDPNDDLTFWSIGEYFNGGRKNQVGVFQIPSAPVAQFSASSTTAAVNEIVTFTDLTSNAPTSWSWTFSPNTVTFTGGTTANSQNPQVQFTAAGSYNVTLLATNSFGSDSEIKNNYITIAPYCTPAYAYGTSSGDYITLVQLGSINNATGASFLPFYTYYNSLSTDLARNSSNTITLSAGTWVSDNNISVWIDYNQNGVFETSEKLGNVTLGATPATGSITFTVPLTAALGVTRMRVREVYFVNDIDPCSLYNYGETEDYNVNILPVQYCSPGFIDGSDYGDYISLVQLGSINNATGALPSPYYNYYSGLSTDLSPGSDYTITLSAGTFPSANNISVWIDFNQNGIFEVNEKLGNVVLAAMPATGSINFTVPANAPSGITRMRVREVFNFSDADPCSAYGFGETEDYNVNIVPIQYCTPSYIDGTSEGDYISLVQLGSISNATGASASPFYTYYSSLSTTLDAGSPYTLTLSPGTFGYGNNMAAWIDYNYDGVFDATEKLGNIDVPPTPSTGSITFTVPVTAFPGTTRMRVREVYFGGDIDPCAEAFYGETEDYNVNIINTNKTLNLTALLEGLFDGVDKMNQAQEVDGSLTQFNKFAGTTVDTLSIYLANASPPYDFVYGAHAINVNPSGNFSVMVPSGLSGNYYIAVFHRSSVQTWSGSAVSFAGSSISYNFTTSASQAYGSNQKDLLGNGSRWGLFTGDVSSSSAIQDGYVDFFDLINIFNLNVASAYGFQPPDLTGDGFVDFFDLAMVYNNNIISSGMNTPPNPAKTPVLKP
ncbi:MAG: GEVED domain-containing protein [Lentimicrobium sp.]